MSIAEKLAVIAENEQKVYDAGYAAGQAEGGGGEDLFFTKTGTMYKRIMHIDVVGDNGIYASVYRDADKMEEVYIPNITSLWTAPGSVFLGCVSLKKAVIPKMKMIGGTYFADCSSLEEVRLGCEDVPVTSIGANAFRGCSALSTVEIIGTVNTAQNFGICDKLGADSVQSIIDCLADLTGQTTQTLTLHANIALTDDQKATISGKNWTLVQ